MMIKMEPRKFADLWRGIFYMVASASLFILMIMFIFIWQPIWTSGFNDFHTISAAITKLNETAKPTADMAPKMLVEMRNMNTSLNQIEITMTDMRTSMKNLEEINPNIVRINDSMDYMNNSMSSQMQQMNYEVDQMSDKFSPFGMMPFNW